MPEELLILNSGIQTIVNQLATPQYIFLDFDGASTSYYNRDLNILIDGILIEDPGFDNESISLIVSQLNMEFGDDIVFTAIQPQCDEYSTIFIGTTKAFDEYGSFYGLAETIDSNNKIHNDNAFVLLNSAALLDHVTDVIAHETEHIVYGMKHEGEVLEQYAYTVIVSSGQTLTERVISSGTSLHVFSGGTANSTTVKSYGHLVVFDGGTVNSTTVNNWGWLEVLDGGTANSTTVGSGGRLYVSSGGTANATILNSGGTLSLSSGGTANRVTMNSGLLFVSNGGKTNSAMVNSGGSLTMSSGGMANSTTVNSGGWLYVFSGGTANCTIVNSGGWQYVNSGGKANSITVSSGGSLHVFSGGTALNIVENGYVVVAEGATVNFVSRVISGLVLYNAMTVHSGTTANSIIVNGGGLYVCNGGIANSTMVNSGLLFVYSGGMANCTMISSGASMDVFSGGMANATIVSSGGLLSVSSGGMANATTLNSGWQVVVNGGTANSTTVNNGGGQYVFSGGTANSTTINSSGLLFVSSGGTANCTMVNSGLLLVSSGGTTNNTTVNSGGLYVSSGGTANETMVNSGLLYLYSGGAHLGRLSLSDGGVVCVKSGARIDFTVAEQNDSSVALINNFSYIRAEDGVNYTITVNSKQAPGKYVLADYAGSFGDAENVSVITTAGQNIGNISASGSVVNHDGNNYSLAKENNSLVLNVRITDSNSVGTGEVLSGKLVWGNTLTVFNGGIVTNNRVEENGNIIVSSGGVANNTIVYFKGSLTVSSGGIANNTSVTIGGHFTVFNGGIASNTDICSDGEMIVYSGGIVNDTNIVYKIDANYQNYLIVSEGGIANSTNIEPGQVLNIYDGGIVNNTIIDWGYLNIYSGGIANNTTIVSGNSIGDGGEISVYGVANNTTVNEGKIRVYSGGVANNVTLNRSGILIVSSGGIAEIVSANSSASLYVKAGGKIDFPAIISGDIITVSGAGGTITGVVSSGGILNLYGCSPKGMIVHSGGVLNTYLSLYPNITPGWLDKIVVDGVLSIEGGFANDTIINSGGTFVVDGPEGFYGAFNGSANNTTVNNGGCLFVFSGCVHSGRLNISDGGTVSLKSGAIIDFTVAEQNDSRVALINNYSNILAEAGVNYTITVNTKQATGKYVLADYADSFGDAENVSVKNTAGQTIGNISVSGSILNYEGNNYSLSKVNNSLVLNIRIIDSIAPTISNIYANVTKPTNGSVHVYADFADETQLASSLYRIGNGSWQNYGGSVLMNDNGIVYFKAIDTAGNTTEKQYSVSNIDKTPPTKPTAMANTNAPTNQNVIVSAVFSEDSVIQQYSLDNENWQSYTTALIFSENGTAYFRGIDEAGNISEVINYNVTNIDKNVVPLSHNVDVYSSGHIVSTNQYISGVNLSSGMSMVISSGGIAEHSIVSAGGSVSILNGGEGRYLETTTSGKIDVSSGGLLLSSYLSGGIAGPMVNVYAGGIASAITVTDGADFTVKGKAFDVVLLGENADMLGDKADLYLHDSAYASNVIVSRGGYLYNNASIAEHVQIKSGGTCNLHNSAVIRDVVLSNGALMNISAKGMVSEATIQSGGKISVSSNVIIDDSIVEFGGRIYVSSGGTLMNTDVYGYVNVGAHAIVSNTLIGSGGNMYLGGGGGASACYTTVCSGGQLDIDARASQGQYGYAKLYGNQVFGGFVNVIRQGTTSQMNMQGNDITFDLTERTAEDNEILNDISWFNNVGHYIVMVNSSQGYGNYAIASNNVIPEIAFELALGDNSIASFGTLDFSNYLYNQGTTYELAQNDGTLSLSVSSWRDFGNAMGNEHRLSWNSKLGNEGISVEIYGEQQETSASFNVAFGNSIDLFGLTTGTYHWSISKAGIEEVIQGNDLAVTTDESAKLLASNADGTLDVFFASGTSRWSKSYMARHVGSLGEDHTEQWEGTLETVALEDKLIIENVFNGSNDASILLLTDDANGDALFVDDIYSAFPDGLDVQARIAKIDEIRAGGGDDVIDLTSQRFVYLGDGVTVRGGIGNDVIWANKGDNWLFGDEGNDRIVGASGNDVIVGGAGNDSLHGGGGEDIFAFGGDWGQDTVEQLATGKVTLWFANGEESKWNASTLTYRDGKNSVTVSGVDLDNISLKFGNEGGDYSELFAAGAFDEFTSERIFEDKNKGMLA